ncbi:MAG TPA: HD-GYP domain-containing protein [Clostridium sp.]|nr:HD-GYP domain-containing protein [Clostridium sp.]
MKHRSIEYVKYALIGLALVFALIRFIKTSDFAYIVIMFAILISGLFTLLPAELENNNKYKKKPHIIYDIREEALTAYIKELDKTKKELNTKNIELKKLFDEMQYGYLQTVMSLANSIEAMDAYTRGHCQRVMEISCEVARVLGLTKEEIEDLRYAAILHDIGKIGVSTNILNKNGSLNEEEFKEIKKHPEIAYNILKDIKFLNKALDGILQHHERYDGRGYPNGLRGNEICIFGRIMCVADAFDAMTSDRPYRKGMKVEDAMRELERCKGTQFDPDIVDMFLFLMDSEKKSNVTIL